MKVPPEKTLPELVVPAFGSFRLWGELIAVLTTVSYMAAQSDRRRTSTASSTAGTRRAFCILLRKGQTGGTPQMKFFLGIAVGALGMWAYSNGKLQELMGGAPEQMQQTWQPAVDRISQVANSDQVKQVASTVQSTVQERMQQMQTPEIARPSASEVAGRPSEPLPTTGA